MKIFKFCLLLVLILVALESGLQLKAYLKRRNSPAVTPITGLNVLVMGDSVIGSSADSTSIYTHLTKDLEKSTGAKINLIDASVMANYSAQANFMADDLIKKYNPQLSIVLLGGSDFLNTKLETSSPLVNSINYIKNFFFKTYLYKLTITLGLQLKNSYRKNIHFSPNPTVDPLVGQLGNSNVARQYQNELYQSFLKKGLSCPATAKLAKLTSTFNKNKASETIAAAEACSLTIPADEIQSGVFFELGNAYRSIKDTDKAKKFLYKSVVKSKHPDEVYSVLFWIAYDKFECPEMFKNYEKILETAEPNRRMLWFMRRCFAENNKNAEGSEYFIRLAPKLKETKNLSLLLAQSLMPEKQDILKSISPGENYYYGSKLQQFRANNDKAGANQLFLRRNLYTETDLYAIDLKHYRELISKLTKDNRKVIVLQYPNQPDWPVLEAIAPIDGNITFISLSSIFEKYLDKYSIYELLTEDLTHISEEGAKIIAEDLAKQITRLLKQD